MAERCWALVGVRRGRLWRVRRVRRVAGGPVSVDADWEWTLAREDRRGDVLGFMHTHPLGAGTAPSARDIRTMRAWRDALGKRLLCLIADGRELSGYVFESDTRQALPIHSIVRDSRDRLVVRE